MTTFLPALLEEAPLTPSGFWTAWSFEPGIVACILVPAVLYAVGARRSRGITRRQMFGFWGGTAMLLLALVSPIDAMGDVLFSGHMAQHEILMLLAAPLFVLARPIPALLWGLPFTARRALGQAAKAPLVRGVWRSVTQPLHAWWIHAAVLWIWHAPALFMATLRNDAIHTAQHFCFFGSALCFWWALFQTHHRAQYGAGVFYIFTTAIHTGILGALMIFSPRVIYTIYEPTTPAWGLTGLEDQQIGGLIMWVPAGIVYMTAGLGLFYAWMAHSRTVGFRSSYAD